MMEIAVLLISLAHQGHWLGGRDNAVVMRWLLDQPMPAATLKWRLQLDRATLAEGTVTFDAGALQQSATIKVRCPAVRVRTGVQWQWSLMQRDKEQVIASGSQKVFVYPNDQLAGLPRLLGEKNLVVIDAPEGLPALLTDSGVKFKRLDSPADLVGVTADILIVAPDRINDAPFAQQPLAGLAQAGTSVCILRQSRSTALLGFHVTPRRAATDLKLQSDHPLLTGLDEDVAPSWLRDAADEPGDFLALRLSADTPAQEIIFFPYQIPEQLAELDSKAQIDALLLTQTLNPGRIVFCQIGLGPWREDVRSQQFLVSLIDFLLSPPRATPSPLERHKKLLSGAKP